MQRHNRRSVSLPPSPPVMMAPIWAQNEGKSRTRMLAMMATPPRVWSGHKVFDIPKMAWAATATATIFNPWMTPDTDSPDQFATP